MHNPFEDIIIILNKIEKILAALVQSEKVKSISSQRENACPLSVKEAAVYLNLAVSTVYSLVRKREIPVNKKGKRLYFYEDELVEWIRTGKIRTRKEISSEANDYIYKKG